MPDKKVVELSKEKEDAIESFNSIPPNSSVWAKIVRPFAFTIFGIIACVIIIPFIVIWRTDDPTCEKIKDILDWGKTVLSPVVGFGAAVVGYYFGTRGSK